MKNLFLFALAAALFAGCSKSEIDDNSEPAGPDSNPNPSIPDVVLNIHVAEKGTLESVLAAQKIDAEQIVSLKITGELNDVDFLTIRNMENLKDIDLADVSLSILPANAFHEMAVKNVVLPKTLTEIGDSAFAGCKLTSIVIPNNVTTIGSLAFENCPITAIEIPASVETIGRFAFYGCSSLTTVTFEKDSQLKIIKSSAFEGCSSLTAIEILASVETIETAAFKSCYFLKTVTFEKGSHLKTIKGKDDSYFCGAFEGCSSLTAIEIPASVETIETAAFKGCSSLKTVTFEKGSHLKIIGGGYGHDGYDDPDYYGAFEGCSSLTAIEIPASVETIETAAFKGCSSLKTVTFEKGSQLKVIDGGYNQYNQYIRLYHGAFCKLENLTTFDASACTQLTTIGNYVFYKDSKLSLFKIGAETPPTCGYFTFSGISSYSVLKVPSGCTDAYKKASGWNNFTSITGLDE